MLQYSISAFLVFVGVISVLTIVSSLEKALKEFNSLIQQRKLLIHDWAEFESDSPPPSLALSIVKPVWLSSSAVYQRTNQLLNEGCATPSPLLVCLKADELGACESMLLRMIYSLVPAVVGGELTGGIGWEKLLPFKFQPDCLEIADADIRVGVKWDGALRYRPRLFEGLRGWHGNMLAHLA